MLRITEPNEGKPCPYFLLGAAIVISRPCRQKRLPYAATRIRQLNNCHLYDVIK